jgi:hypothetical protein
MEMAWSKLSNGELLDAAEKQFDLLITTDKMLPAQQNLSARKIAILILPFASWPRLKPHVAKVASQIRKLRAGDCVELQLE